MNDKRCATCCWHWHYDICDGWVCVNVRGDYCCDLTDDNFCCEKWEAKN